MQTPSTPGRERPVGLALELEISVTRVGRARCTLCRRRRELLRLSALGNEGLIGHGLALCRGCAGLRAAR